MQEEYSRRRHHREKRVRTRIRPDNEHSQNHHRAEPSHQTSRRARHSVHQEGGVENRSPKWRNHSRRRTQQFQYRVLRKLLKTLCRHSSSIRHRSRHHSHRRDCCRVRWHPDGLQDWCRCSQSGSHTRRDRHRLCRGTPHLCSRKGTREPPGRSRKSRTHAQHRHTS